MTVSRTAELIAARIDMMIDRYEQKPFTRGIAEILVVCNVLRFHTLGAYLEEPKYHRNAIEGYIQRRNVMIRPVHPSMPDHKLRGCVCIMVLFDHTIPLDEFHRTQLNNTLMSARLAGFEGADIEYI